MFGDDTELRKLRQDWDGMSYDEKVDKFLWKMVWFHHEKYVPGSPSPSINSLAETISKASESSDKLSHSIKIATWVAGIAAAAGVILSFLSLNHEMQPKNIEVRQKVFDECFDYYANSNKDEGVSETLIQTCRDKARSWSEK